MDTANKQAVGISAGDVVILFPRARLKPDEAMMFAAWVVVMAQMQDGKLPAFSEYLAAVENT